MFLAQRVIPGVPTHRLHPPLIESQDGRHYENLGGTTFTRIWGERLGERLGELEERLGESLGERLRERG